LLSALDGLVAKKEAFKRGMMEGLLSGEIRLAGFLGAWEETTFDQVITGFSSGATPRRSIKEYYAGDIPWITSSELNYNVITHTIENITEEAVSRSNLSWLEPGTFLIAITGLEAAGTRGSCGIIGIKSTSNQSCMALTPIEGKLTVDYLFQYYTLFGDQLALEYCQGTKQQSYTGKIVKILPIKLPKDVEEQHAIATFLSDLDAELSALRARRKKLGLVKGGMMEVLLSGGVRLV
jgi:type I restriction enzyme S subunit